MVTNFWKGRGFPNSEALSVITLPCMQSGIDHGGPINCIGYHIICACIATIISDLLGLTSTCACAEQGCHRSYSEGGSSI